MFENADLFGTNWGKRYFDVLPSNRTILYMYKYITGERYNRRTL